MPISKQDLSKQRSYLDPLIFKQANFNAISDIYNAKDYPLKKFKGYFVFGIDGSQAELPNTPQTREEFDVQLRALKKTETPKARISALSDVYNDFIIDSTISPMSTTEEILAFEHIEQSDKIIDLKKSIILFDRYYASIELFMQLLSKKSNFIFRLKKSDYKKERTQMKTNNEWVNINLNSARTKNIKNKELKDKAKQMDHLTLRIVNIELKTGEIETLITNLPDEIASPQELKELYSKRWQIETGYDLLKNKIHLENFSGKRKIIIEQDFYAQILLYNIIIEYKNKCNHDLKEKNETEYEIKVNMNILTGKLKNNLIKMVFSKTEKEMKQYKEEIYKTAKKHTIKEKKKKTTKRKKTSTKKYPFNNRKNF
ncbi:MAG: IS4 family transposase [Methanobrevibacter sp.]|nr:IS4 family transposase [Methanobrevibacter sp.]